MRRHEHQPSDAEYSLAASWLGQQFIQRWDLYARQLDDGRYICVREPLSEQLLVAHLSGRITLGVYLLDQDNQVRFIVFDDDRPHGLSSLVDAAQALQGRGVPSYVEQSRRGGHLWLFFGQAIPGDRARAFAQGIVHTHGLEAVEVFPKQDTLGEGVGSLIRLPFGFHRRSMRRYGFFTPTGEPLAPRIREQIALLSSPAIVPEDGLATYQSVVPPPLVSDHAELSPPSTDMLSDRIRSAVTALEFVSQYVPLKLTQSGALGLCPFHDDHHPSLSVNDTGNYWHCFAGCGGGSIIDFWMKWRNCDFTTAVTELADMLL